MFKRSLKKQNKIKRAILKFLNLYALDKVNFNFVNPNLENNSKNIHIFNELSFNLAHGYTKLSRKINSLDIYYRFAPTVKLWNSTNTWKRIIPHIDKEMLIKVCSLSLKNSLIYFIKKNQIKVNLNFVYDRSNKEFNDILFELMKNDFFQINFFESKISGNHGSYLSCCDLSKNAKDLIFFIEDDYLFELNSIEESIISYSKISSLLGKDIFMCPSDYPFYYDKNYKTYLMFGKDHRWRYVGETLLTFIFSKNLLKEHEKNIRWVGERKNDPFEKPLHDIFKVTPCFAPVGSLCHHLSRKIPDLNDGWLELWNYTYNEVINGGP